MNSDKVISENNDGKKCPLADPFSTPVQELALHGSQHGAIGKRVLFIIYSFFRFNMITDFLKLPSKGIVCDENAERTEQILF